MLGLNLLYVMLLSFLFFQDKQSARQFVRYFDSSLGVPLPEKSYAENCEFTPSNVWDGVDIFVVAHALGWFGKAVILRDHWSASLLFQRRGSKLTSDGERFCWALSLGFEIMEYSLEHQLPNFAGPSPSTPEAQLHRLTLWPDCTRTECWWDHWILDVLLANWAGLYLGMKVRPPSCPRPRLALTGWNRRANGCACRRSPGADCIPATWAGRGRRRGT